MANYMTEEEATAYFLTRLNSEAYDVATTADRLAALTMATESIDRLNYLGAITESDQANQFPRDADTVVPDDIKKASAEIALMLLDGFDMELEFEQLNMVSQGYANVRSTYDRTTPPPHIVAGIASSVAWRYLKPYLRDVNTLSINRVS
jgi:hypothetical protein